MERRKTHLILSQERMGREISRQRGWLIEFTSEGGGLDLLKEGEGDLIFWEQGWGHEIRQKVF